MREARGIGLLYGADSRNGGTYAYSWDSFGRLVGIERYGSWNAFDSLASGSDTLLTRLHDRGADADRVLDIEG